MPGPGGTRVHASQLPDACTETTEYELEIGVLPAVENLGHILVNGLTNRATRQIIVIVPERVLNLN